MSLAKLYSRALRGIHSPEVMVEVHVAPGLPSFSIVGLADTEIKESRDRVRSAIQMSGFEFPARRITVNLAPADLPKDSSRFDLAIAVGVLLASGRIKSRINLEKLEFAGELALDGGLRRVHGALAMASFAVKSKRDLVLPLESAVEANLIEDVNVLVASSLNEVVKHITQDKNLHTLEKTTLEQQLQQIDGLDFNQVKGQQGVKTALTIAASGRHSVLMVGNPGCGKSMLAKRMVGILPPLNTQEALDTAQIYSVSSSGFNSSSWRVPPFRSPHHSASQVALVGGGSNPRPGEISLAHNGILFLDEILEFERRTLEVLREPLENKNIAVSRANYKIDFPADFQLIAAMNPCPCGNYGANTDTVCKCSDLQIARYRSKLSAPLLDRIDLIVQVPKLGVHELQNLDSGDSSLEIRQRVIESRKRQLERQGKLNYALQNHEVEQVCVLSKDAQELVANLTERFSLSARAYYRLLKVARTIADIDARYLIESKDIAQGTQFKQVF